MTQQEAVERLTIIFAHAWMVRRFLKHAEEIEDDVDMLKVHRMIYDYIRATEPSRERGDHKEFLRRAKSKLPKLRRVSEYFSQEWKNVSSHTNFEMAALSLAGCVKQIDEILASVESNPAPSPPQE